MMEDTILKISLFCFGAIIGSFLNVCIYRMSRRESIVRPSHRYFLVEMLTAALFLFLSSCFGLSLFFWIYAALCSGLIVVSFIDIDIREIPDEISLGGIAIGLILSLIFPRLQETAFCHLALMRSFLGILAGGGSIYVTGLIGKAVFKKESIGGGDVKLMGMVGAFIGWKLALLAFFIAPFFGSIVGIALKIRKGKSLIPYGPFLSLAALISIIWGKEIIASILF